MSIGLVGITRATGLLSDLPPGGGGQGRVEWTNLYAVLIVMPLVTCILCWAFFVREDVKWRVRRVEWLSNYPPIAYWWMVSMGGFSY